MTDTRPTDALIAHNPIFEAILMVFTGLNYKPLQEVVNARRKNTEVATQLAIDKCARKSYWNITELVTAIC